MAIPGGVLSGTVVLTEDGLQLSHFELTLDTQDSDPPEGAEVIDGREPSAARFDLTGKVAVVTGSTGDRPGHGPAPRRGRGLGCDQQP